MKKNRVLVIGDIHCPCERKGYMQFTKDINKKYKCNQTIFIGDIVDNHAVSFYTKHPELPGAKDEYELAYEHIQRWYRAFPKAKIAIGNHDIRVIKAAESVGIPAKFLRDFAEVWNTPNWIWDWEFLIDDVVYTHGTRMSGIHPAYTNMRKMATSLVLGHNHSAAGIKYLVNARRRLFSMDVGCGVDDSSLAFVYGKHSRIRSVISCGVVIDGIPYLEIMPIQKGEKYYDGNF